MAVDTAAMATDDWLTPAQAALRLERTPAMVRYLMDHGRLRHRRTPLGRLVDPSSVDELRRARDAGSRGDKGAA